MGCFIAVFSIAPSDYWLSRRMQQVTSSLLSQKSKIGSKIGSPPKIFFRDGIRKLPERWEKVVSSDGQYFNWSVHSFCFEINAFLNTKKRTELICTLNIIIITKKYVKKKLKIFKQWYVTIIISRIIYICIHRENFAEVSHLTR